MDFNTYDLINPPAIHCQKPALDRYREQDVRCLPITIKSENNRYVVIGLVKKTDELTKNEVYTPTVVTASDCINKCKDTLGLKVNEIAKLIGISRATLDLHKKGSPVKNMEPYERLYAFVSDIEGAYGTSISKGVRNVLVERKTLVQHLISNRDDLSQCKYIIDEVASKLGNVNTFKTKVDESKANLRLTGIGRMA